MLSRRWQAKVEGSSDDDRRYLEEAAAADGIDYARSEDELYGELDRVQSRIETARLGRAIRDGDPAAIANAKRDAADRKESRRQYLVLRAQIETLNAEPSTLTGEPAPPAPGEGTLF